jgi:hypothetical protein
MLLTYDPNPHSSTLSERAVPGGQGVRARIRRAQDALSSRRKTMIPFVIGFAAITVAFMLWPAIDPGLKVFYERTIAAQAGRSSPFSVWGQAEWLEPLRVAILAGVGVLSVALAFVPRKKSLLQVAALSAALMIGVQLTLHHWFYLYIVWFFPLLLVALALLERTEEPDPDEVPDLRWPLRRRRPPEPAPTRSSPPVPTG